MELAHQDNPIKRETIMASQPRTTFPALPIALSTSQTQEQARSLGHQRTSFFKLQTD